MNEDAEPCGHNDLAQVPCRDSLPCFVCLFVVFSFLGGLECLGVASGAMEEEEEEEEHGHCWSKDKVLGFRVYPSNFLLHNPSKLVCHFW
jgi:hypothetical protein